MSRACEEWLKRECEVCMESVCVSERRVHVVCVWDVCEMCVRVKGEHTEVCMSVRVQEKNHIQEKSREHKRMQSVCSLKLRANEQERKRAENEREERETLSLEKLPVSLYPKRVVCVYLLCAFQIFLLPIENSITVSRLNPSKYRIYIDTDLRFSLV